YALTTPGDEDLQVVLRYPDGSTATIGYVTNGPSGFPKETLDLVADGRALRLDDFVRASVYDGRQRWVSSRLPKARDKGQAAQLAAFVRAVRTGGAMPVPLEALVATTAATLAVRAGAVGAATHLPGRGRRPVHRRPARGGDRLGAAGRRETSRGRGGPADGRAGDVLRGGAGRSDRPGLVVRPEDRAPGAGRLRLRRAV